MEDKELAEALNGFYVLMVKGCTCGLHVFHRPFRSELIYNDSCTIHTEQWRREYLGLLA